MSYKINPKRFNPKFKVVGCIIESNKKMVMLQRKAYSIQGNRWGVPSGKVKYKESLIKSIKREIEEETGIRIKKNKIKFIRKYKVRHSPGYDLVYYLFHTKLKNEKNIKLNKKEHKNAKWISIKRIFKLHLVEGTDECIKSFYKL